jgi:hypothetical protein
MKKSEGVRKKAKSMKLVKREDCEAFLKCDNIKHVGRSDRK